MFWSGISICLFQLPWTIADWKWSRMGCQISVDPSWLWTRLWCVPCIEMVRRIQEQPTRRVWSNEPGGARNAGTQSWWGRGSRARLVVFAIEVGGRWSPELQSYVAQFAKSKARKHPFFLQRRFEQAWWMWWGGFFACTVEQAVATCLLDLRCVHGANGQHSSWCRRSRRTGTWGWRLSVKAGLGA